MTNRVDSVPVGPVVDVKAHSLFLPDRDVPDLGTRLAAMDAAAVDVQAVAAANRDQHDRDDRRQAGEETAELNRRIAALVRRAPDRLVGVGAVALRHPDLATEQLRRAVDDYDFRGVQICANPAGRDLTDPVFEGFWRMATTLGIVVFVRPAGRGVDGGQASGLGDVLHRFPGLVVCSTPGGSDGPRRDSTGWYVDSAVPDIGTLRRLVACVGAGRVLRGSGYPFENAAPLRDVDLTRDERILIDGATASSLLRLSAGMR